MSLRTIPADINEGGKFRATASGTLPNGKPVIVNSDGTVSAAQIIETTYVEDIPQTESQFAGNIYDGGIGVDYDPFNANKFVVAYGNQDVTFVGLAKVGTVSGSSISYSTTYQFTSNVANDVCVAFDPSTQGSFVIAYRDETVSGYGKAVVGTISGTTLSFGSEYTFNTGSTEDITVSFDPNNAGKFLITYRDASNGSYGTAVVGTVSGTTISFSSEQVINSAFSFSIYSSFDPFNANTFIVSFRDGGVSNYGTAVVCTLSGTTISVGTKYVFNSGVSNYSTINYDKNTANKFAVAYYDSTNGLGEAVVGTTSGTTISFGTPVVFNSENSDFVRSQYNPSQSDKFIIGFRNYNNGTSTYEGKIVVGTISGTTISFGTPYSYNTSAPSPYDVRAISIAFDTNTPGKFILAYDSPSYTPDRANIVLGQVGTVASLPNLTSENYIGISTGGNVADTANATVDIIGTLNEEQSGLTPGQSYYVQTDGTLSTTPDDPSVFAGTAISATSLVVKT